MSKPIRVLIADNDVDFVTSLTDFLAQEADLKVVEVVRDGPGAVKACRVILPDLILLDLHLPVLDSIKVIRAILAENDRVHILVTSAIANDRYAVEAVKAGAAGYIQKDGLAGYQAMTEAMRHVARGELLLSPALAASILAEFQRLTN
jgi:two-component system response regulator DegU